MGPGRVMLCQSVVSLPPLDGKRKPTRKTCLGVILGNPEYCGGSVVVTLVRCS